MQYIAHIKTSGDEQPLKDHLLGVAKLARQFGQAFSAGELAYAAGLLHDIGKYKSKFQDRIRGKPIAVTHSTAGALIVRQESGRLFGITKCHKHLADLVAFAIAFHHGGLRNYGTMDEDGSLRCRLVTAKTSPDEQAQLWEAAWQEIELPALPVPTDGRLFANLLRYNDTGRYSWKMAFLGRMLYSTLVDADTVDTRNFCDPRLAALAAPDGPILHELYDRLKRHLADTYADVPDTTVNRYRRAILARCRRQARLKPGLFALTVPTGGGKTFSSLAFALRHAKRYGHRRIIYVIPFTSIIEQNAKHFRKALGDDAVLEYHSNFNWKEAEEHLGEEEARRVKLSAENWDAPVVVTTSVQFFESLFASKRSKCRKLHNIAGSVIVLDEAQSLPRGYLEPCLRALEELTEGYGCSVVLCTATQPSWKGLGRNVVELMDKPSPTELFEEFKRVGVDMLDEDEGVTTNETIAAMMMRETQALCIVNTRRHAKLLLGRFDRRTEGLYHLSGRMTPLHRLNVLESIRLRLKHGLPCLVVSTQLIEAGVDVDFPVVFRAMAGIDSIAQAAGRCNREGLLDTGRLIVFRPEPHGMPSKGWLKETAIEAVSSIRKFGASETLSLDCVSDYFERVHGLLDPENGPRLRDAEDIVKLLGNMPHIPYEEVAERFRFIDSVMETVVVPWLPKDRRDSLEDPYGPIALKLIDELTTAQYPASVMRKLQPYAVQVYRHELKALAREGFIRNVQGVWVLNDLAHYDELSGLLTPADEADHEVNIF